MKKVTAKKEREILGITNSKYINYISRGLLVCSTPATENGKSNKYSRVDTIKNKIFIALLETKIEQEFAHTICSGINTSKNYYSVLIANGVHMGIDVSNFRKLINEYF